jgi:Uma2 family endonuclease
MGRSRSTTPRYENLSQLWERLGRIPLSRIRMEVPPGTATERDVIRAESRFNRHCELIDGTLVEKAMGIFESRLAGLLFHYLEDFLEENDLGLVFTTDAMLRVEPMQVRMPDVCFYSWGQFPDRTIPEVQILDSVPDLTVEVLSPGNTKREMERKRKEYFLGGCKLYWELDPVKRTVRVYTAPDESKLVRERGTLDGGEVLPGFRLPLTRLFARSGRRRA